jgi:hypothetical protein
MLGAAQHQRFVGQVCDRHFSTFAAGDVKIGDGHVLFTVGAAAYRVAI